MSKIIELGKIKNNQNKELPQVVDRDVVLASAPVIPKPEINKVKPKRRIRWRLILILLMVLCFLGAFATIAAFGFNFKTLQETKKIFDDSTCTGKICEDYKEVKIDDSTCVGILCNNNKYNLPKTNGRTNVLFTGVDTRESGNKTFLTDTIILMSYDYESGNAYMISFPRDIVLTYENYSGITVKTKINEMYFNGGGSDDHHQEGMLTLQKAVEEITGLTVHYNAMITLRGFVDLIDKLGGIDLDIKETTTDVYPLVELPKAFANSKCKSIVYVEDGNYCLWTLNAGINHLDGQTALLYARSRKYSSDWVRAGRQQEVINAARTKITSSSTLSNPQNLFDIIQTLKDNIKISNYTLNDILAALDLKESVKNTIQVVLDPSFGDGKLIGSGPSGTYLGSHQVFLNSTFEPIQEYLQYIYSNPISYKEKPNIYLYSDVATSLWKKDYIEEIGDDSNYPGTIISYVPVINSQTLFGLPKVEVANSSSSTKISTSTDKNAYTVYIIDYTGGKKNGSLEKLKAAYPEFKLISGNKPLNEEDFAIIISKN